MPIKSRTSPQFPNPSAGQSESTRKPPEKVVPRGLREFLTFFPREMDQVRLAIPRRAYTQSHIEHVVEVILDVWRKREQIRGYEIIHQAKFLRHFSARLKPVAS